MPTVQPSRRVAILVDFLYDYQLQLQHGFQAALNEAGLSSLTFVGRHLQVDHPVYHMANGLYSLLNPADYLGMIVSAASLGRSVDDEAFQAFLSSYALPQVTVSRPLPGIPAVTVDNTAGLLDLMAHLVHGRGFTKFVFVGGMAGNQEAAVREGVVRRYLEEHGLTLPPQRVLTGDFYGPKAAQEITRLLACDRDFEVVVCANDEMAFGVMGALARHGLNVPGDVAVVGFDDVLEASCAEPPLTTVGQPTFEAGEAAVKALLRIAAGNEVPEETVLTSTLIRRKSCGALPEWPDVPLPALTPALQAAFEAAVCDPVRVPFFLESWRHAIGRRHHDRSALQAIVLALGAQGALAAQPPTVQERLAQLLLLALSMIDKPEAARVSLQQALSRNNQMSSYLELSLSSHEDPANFADEAGEYLRSLEIERYALVLFDEPAHQPGVTAHVACSSFPPAQAQGQGSFPSLQLLPETLQAELDRGHFLIVPLFSGELQFGLLLFEKPQTDHFHVEQMRYTLSSGLHHLHAVQQRQCYTQQLEQQVRERTQALQNEIAVRVKAENTLRLLNQELSLSASTDGLTGIFNRAAFTSYFEREWLSHQETRRSLSLLMVDIDCFKQFNDHYGHLAGDECLRQIARTLDACGRNRNDCTARYGGEEFVLLLPDTDQDGAVLVAERLLASVRHLAWPHARSTVSRHVTVSIGVATLIPEAPLPPERLVAGADQALYQAKQSGRDQYVISPQAVAVGTGGPRGMI